MSLEDALNKNTAAVLAHNTLLEKMLAGAGGKPAAAPAGKPAAAPAGKPAAAPAGKPATTTKKKAETTVEVMAEKVTAYLKGGAADERAGRKVNVKAIIDYFGVERFTGIDPSQFDEALGYLVQFEAGEDPFAQEGDEPDGGDGDDDGVV